MNNGLRFQVFDRDHFTCTYCGRKPPKVQLEPDHIIPKHKYGTDDLANLITSCKDCNRGKSISLRGTEWAKNHLSTSPNPDQSKQKMAPLSELIAARVGHWQAFKFRKFCERNEVPLGLGLTFAIMEYLAEQLIPEDITRAWLDEYYRIYGHDQW